VITPSDQPYAHFDLTSGCRLGVGIILPVFPYLISADWPDATRYVSQPIVTDPLAPQIPLAALAYLLPSAPLFVDAERLQRMARNHAQVHAEAVANLKKRTASWQLQTLPDDDLQYAICNDDELAAERILDKSFLLEVTRLLDTPSQVAVGVPHRGLLVAAGLNLPAEKVRRFKLNVQEWHANAGDAALSPLLFRVIFGAPMGVIHFEGRANL
jgi:hypothetical protein